MDPIIAAALISAGSQVLGGAIGSVGQSRANDANWAIAQEQNRLNYKLFQEQNKFNLDMYHHALGYNTPEQQRKRYEQAGFNPYFAMSNISAGLAQSLTSATPSPASGATHQNALASIGAGVSSAGNSVSNAVDLRARIALADAQRRNTEADTIGKSIENGVKPQQLQAEIRKTEAEADKAVFDVQYLRSMSELQKQELISKIQLNVVNARVQATVESLNLADLRLKPLQERQLRAVIGQVYQSTAYLASQGKVAEAQVEKIAQDIVLSKAQELNIDANTQQIKAVTKPMVDKLNAEVRSTNAQAGYMEGKTSYLSEENARAWIDTSVNVLSGATGMFSNLFGLGLL